MIVYGTLTIHLEFVRKRDGQSTWNKVSTLVRNTHIDLDHATEIAQQFKRDNPKIADDLVITWQADPVFIAGRI